jgi:trk system potassium uptake protein TrkA
LYIVIIGGGKVGYNLTKMLLESGHEVTLIEHDPALYEDLFEELNEKVVFGEGSDLEILKKAGANRADYVLALTGDDEVNLVICQLVKSSFISPKTLARINDPQNEAIMSTLGVDLPVNVTRLINHLVSEEVHAHGITPVHIFRDGTSEIVEIEVSGSSPLVGKALSALNLTPPSSVIAIGREGKGIVTSGSDATIEDGDFLIVLTNKDAEKKLRKNLGLDGA